MANKIKKQTTQKQKYAAKPPTLSMCWSVRDWHKNKPKTKSVENRKSLGILAVAKTQFPVKAKLRVRDFMPKSEGKHEKTKLKPLQKKEDTKSS